jgi:hypothetical protein
MEDVGRVRYVVENYYPLQGLIRVPYGTAMLMLGMMRLKWLPKPEWIGDNADAFNLGLVIAAVLYALGQFYYRHTFGNVQPLPGIQKRFLLGALVVFAALAGAIIIDSNMHLPVLVFGLVLAGLLLVYSWPRRKYAMHYLLMAPIAAAVSLLPLFGAVSQDQYSGIGLTVWGLTILVGGILDHLLLVRTLKPARETVDD